MKNLKALIPIAFAVIGLVGDGARMHGQETSPAWTFESIESADLVFHGLAVVGFQGFSSLPLYDRAYADRVRALKEEKGVYPTALDRQAGQFLRAFESDSTFELLHFLPLYFRSAQTSTVLEVFSEVATGSGARMVSEDAAFASSVVDAVLRDRDQRRILGEFADALREEWNVFLRDHSSETSSVRNAALATASNTWNARVAPAIESFLASRQMAGGMVMVSPALGPEGRVFAGSPENTTDNVLAVSLAHNETGLGASAFLLKELCYPVASGVVEALGMSRDRVTAERLSGTLAVRCGAELLGTNAVSLVDDYRTTFMAAAAASGIAAPTFATAFSVDAGALERLRRELRGVAR
jgi:hypothetical protein